MPRPRKSAAHPDDSRALLLVAAKPLFAKYGLDGTTVRDIAKAAGTNICMISYHFEGKEGLYRACLEEFGRSRLEHAKSLLGRVTSPDDFRTRLRLLIRAMLEAHLAEPDLFKILMREFEAGLPVARDVYEKTFLLLLQAIIGFFKSAQKAGFVRQELDPFYLTMIVHGSMGHLIRMQYLAKHYYDHSLSNPKQRETFVESLLTVLLEGSLTKTKRKATDASA